MSNQETRTRLLETALDLIWRSNYNAVGVNEICKQAGVTKGSFYHYFESKAALFCEASEHSWQSAKSALDEIMSPMTPPIEQLKQYIRFVYERKFDEQEGLVRGCPYSCATAHVETEDESMTNKQRSMLTKAVTYNAALVHTLNSQGFLENASDESRIARLCSQYIHGIVGFARIEKNFNTIKGDTAEGLFRILGLKKEFWFDPFEE